MKLTDAATGRKIRHHTFWKDGYLEWHENGYLISQAGVEVCIKRQWLEGENWVAIESDAEKIERLERELAEALASAQEAWARVPKRCGAVGCDSPTRQGRTYCREHGAVTP